MLANIHSNNSAKAIVEAEGNKLIQYGITYEEYDAEEGKIVIADKEAVRTLKGAWSTIFYVMIMRCIASI